jgi:predicted cupin superfamily sugar epimerase
LRMSSKNIPEQLIRHYLMEPHPEGGYYTSTYRSSEILSAEALPDRFSGPRCISSAIYFLLEGEIFSAFHRIKSDELWHFYTGDGLLIYVIEPSGEGRILKLGSDIENGFQFQHCVPAGCWFASRPANRNSFSFVGCTVAPGFDFADFEMANRTELLQAYPQHATWIEELCRS